MENNQYSWTPPTDINYPFHYLNDMYGMDYSAVYDNKNDLRPFDGITIPPIPGKNYSTYTDYDTGLFGYSRKDYKSDTE